MNQQELFLGQYFAADSWLHRLEPRSKIAATFLLLTAFSVADNYPALATLLLGTLLLVTLSRIPLLIFVRNLRAMVWLLLITMLIPLLFTPGSTLFAWGFINISREGLLFGGLITVRLIVVLLLSSLLTLTTTPLDLTQGVARLLAPFQRIGLPVQELALIMGLALRFIPTLLEETAKLIKAQEARGARLNQGSLLARMKAYIPILIPLFMNSFRRADQLTLAMEARCYRGAMGRTSRKQLTWRWPDTLAVAVCLLALGAVLVVRSWYLD